MGSSSGVSDAVANFGGFSSHEVRSHLGRVLASPSFRTSKRCHRFLEFVVVETLSGRASALKEHTLAVEVFDRSEPWDSRDDTIVRVGAREVRRRLAQYYTIPEGSREAMRIELPPGSYVPRFAHPDASSAAQVKGSDLPEIASVHTYRAGARRTWVSIIGAIAILIVAAVLALHLVHWQQNLFDQFWAPFWQSSEPVLVAIAHPLVYQPSSRAVYLNNQLLGADPNGTQRPLKVPPDELNGSDIVPVPNHYVGFGDAAAAVRVFQILTTQRQQAHLRLASKVEFADFRQAPVIFIGAFTNRWTMKLTRNFRFHFGHDRKHEPEILDSADPSHSWHIPDRDNGTAPEDYFLICRLINSPSGKPMLFAAGLQVFGTQAAGLFLADRKYLDQILRPIRDEWQTENLEIVLHAKVIENSPATPEMVAWHVW